MSRSLRPLSRQRTWSRSCSRSGKRRSRRGSGRRQRCTRTSQAHRGRQSRPGGARRNPRRQGQVLRPREGAPPRRRTPNLGPRRRLPAVEMSRCRRPTTIRTWATYHPRRRSCGSKTARLAARWTVGCCRRPSRDHRFPATNRQRSAVLQRLHRRRAAPSPSDGPRFDWATWTAFAGWRTAMYTASPKARAYDPLAAKAVPRLRVASQAWPLDPAPGAPQGGRLRSAISTKPACSARPTRPSGCKGKQGMRRARNPPEQRVRRI